MRINKFLANNNICSRRKVDELISNGLVLINQKAAQLGQKLNDFDEVFIKTTKQTLIYNEEDSINKFYVALNKAEGISCTCLKSDSSNIISYLNQKITERINKLEKAPQKNKTEILELKELKEQRIYPIGRLDKASQGLILLSNDGDYANKLMHPSFKHEKEYEVKFDRKISKELINSFINGAKIKIDTGEIKQTAAAKVKKIDNYTLSVCLEQGLNRQIRRIAGLHEYKVLKLERVRIKNLHLKELKGNDFIYSLNKELC